MFCERCHVNKMNHIYSFPPVENADAEVLILGSMPGLASLAAGQYYAHQRNAFWRIMAELLGFPPDTLPYPDRLRALRSAHIALWDVLHACERSGSLDANIVAATRIPNDFAAFFGTHHKIRHVYFNGGGAELSFRQLVLPFIPCPTDSFTRLPSTSPANAMMTFVQKLAVWRVVVNRS